jgi:hypothetical protein
MGRGFSLLKLMTFEDTFRAAAQKLGCPEVLIELQIAQLRQETGAMGDVLIPPHLENQFLEEMLGAMVLREAHQDIRKAEEN